MSDRKPHVRVEQHYYLDWVKEYGATPIEDFIATFDVSYSTAKRNLDGLVHQGKLKLDPESNSYFEGENDGN